MLGLERFRTRPWGEVLDRALADERKRNLYLNRKINFQLYPWLEPLIREAANKAISSLGQGNFKSRTRGIGRKIGGKGEKDRKELGGDLSELQRNHEKFQEVLLEEIREVIAAPATVNIAERHAKEKGEYAEFKTLFKAKFIQGAAARINPQAKIEGEIIKSRPELVIAAAKAAALEDFLAQHPAELTGQQKLNIITETGRIWNLADHPLIKGILEAESAMSNVFEAYSATPEQRKTWIAAYAKARRKAEALKEAWQYFERELEKRIPKTRIPTATTATTKKKEIDPVAQFVSSLTHLTPKQRRTISWAIQRLDEKGHLSPAESLERFKRYSGPDQHIFAGQLVREHETREEEATGEKLRPKVEPPEGITETPTDLLERIEESKYLDASDIGILRKAITARAFDGERRIAAIKHILLFGLAKETTLFRIARRNLPRRMLPRPFYDEGKQATDELFREGKLVSRPDHPKTAMIANRELMQKYRGTERLL